MSQQIYIGNYWPFFFTGLRQFQYSTKDGAVAPYTSNFYYDNTRSSMAYENYAADGTFLNKWFMQIRPAFGVAEWRDDYPPDKDNPRGKIIVMDPPIGWGNVETVPGNYYNKIETDPWQCIPFTIAEAEQTVVYEELLPTFTTWHGDTFENVLVFSYAQKWGKNVSGARYWMAENIGPIGVSFIIQNPDGTFTTWERSDAKVVEFNEQQKHDMFVKNASKVVHKKSVADHLMGK
jgi:hypothetical protein